LLLAARLPKTMNQARNSDVEHKAPGRERFTSVTRLARAETMYVLVMFAFALLAVLAHGYGYFAWDLAVAHELQAVRAPGFAEFMRLVSVPGNGWISYALVASTVIAFLAFGCRSEAAGLSLSAGGGELLNRLLKLVIARPRPAADQVLVFRHLTSESFPSGHVTFYVCYFGFLFFIAYALLPRGSIARRLALLFTALPVALVGPSRVYLGVHWPSDVLGAYLFGGLWLALCLHLYRCWKERSNRGNRS
jgi:membrane-associated phospholipid phosphatase